MRGKVSKRQPFDIIDTVFCTKNSRTFKLCELPGTKYSANIVRLNEHNNFKGNRICFILVAYLCPYGINV